MGLRSRRAESHAAFTLTRLSRDAEGTRSRRSRGAGNKKTGAAATGGEVLRSAREGERRTGAWGERPSARRSAEMVSQRPCHPQRSWGCSGHTPETATVRMKERPPARRSPGRGDAVDRRSETTRRHKRKLREGSPVSASSPPTVLVVAFLPGVARLQASGGRLDGSRTGPLGSTLAAMQIPALAHSYGRGRWGPLACREVPASKRGSALQASPPHAEACPKSLGRARALPGGCSRVVGGWADR